MKLGHELILQQSQKLILTPELQQAIELLQFNNQELREYIENEVQENPMLEIEEKSREDIDWKEYFEKEERKNFSNQYDIDRDNSDYNYSNFVSYNPSLKEVLLLQLNVLNISKEDLKIGYFIIEHLDINGYLTLEIEEISNQLEVLSSDVLEILRKIQKFEPIGVGARSLEECLKIQLEDLEIFDEKIHKVVEEHLEDIGNNNLNKICNDVNSEITEVKEICKIIKKLNPKPGQEYGNNESIKYIQPDATIKKVNGEYIVSLNEESSPRLNINNFYKDMILSQQDKKTTEYLNKKLDSALWVIRTIEQRKNTILKVLKAILKYQIDFFEKGEQYLKPLTLKDIAKEIDMHESTVSRTTNGKYVQTPQGLFEFKYFFSSSISSDDGDMSSKSIKYKIKRLIDREDKKKPYSDQKIANILNKEGIDISRRTVAKYRDEMEILSSMKRKSF